jgi:DUF2971 family protein
MRAYKFIDLKFGLKCLREKRLKISTVHDLNDPFELLPYNVGIRNHRKALKKTRANLAAKRGLLCLSVTWHDPVMWAHYADKHRGVCLGFEIPRDRDLWRRVSYRVGRLPFPAAHSATDIEAMLFTKYSNWEYEQEIRMWAQLKEPEGNLYFYDFDETLRLVEVIVGARCVLSRRDLSEALGVSSTDVTVIKARPAFRSFRIVQQHHETPVK